VSEKTTVTKCSIDVRNLPLEAFRLPTDGRKWKQSARSRFAVLHYLSSFANPDGTFVGEHGKNFSPSHETLIKKFSKGTLHYTTTALQELGLLSWTREEKHYGRRTYTIHLPEHSQDSPETSPITLSTLDGEKAEHSQNSAEHSQRSTITLSTSNPNPSIPSLPTKANTPSAGHKKDSEAKTLGKKLKESVREISAVCFAECNSTPRDKDIKSFLTEYTQEWVEKGLRAYAAGKEENELKWLTKNFFVDGGGHGAILALQQKEAADAERADDEARSIEAGLAAALAKQEEFLKQVADEDELVAILADNPFGEQTI
jgi:hypothetical protein